MSTTKQTKDLLEQVRLRLDKESRAAVEPFLRSILEIAKPKTVTQVEYGSDPHDKCEIETLNAAVVAKDEQIRKLRFELASAQEELRRAIVSKGDELQKLRSTLTSAHRREVGLLRERIVAKEDQLCKLPAKLAKAELEDAQWQKDASLDDLLIAVDKMANKFMRCIIKCMCVARFNSGTGRKKEILLRSVVLGNVVLTTYLNQLESCGGVDGKKLKRIIDDNSSEALTKIAHDIHASAGIEVDLSLPINGKNNLAKFKSPSPR